VIGTTPLATLLSVGEVLVWPTVARADPAGSNIARPNTNTMMKPGELRPLFRSRMKNRPPQACAARGQYRAGLGERDEGADHFERSAGG
jgi:hypothetical protein